jgi:uncharacterized repeat protein (TIGR02543 family)
MMRRSKANYDSYSHGVSLAGILRVAAPALLLLCLSSCKGSFEQADLEEFVDTGLTNVLIRSATFSPGSAELELIPSGKPIACSLEIVNPKNFDVKYTLSLSDGSLFSPAPNPKPRPSDPTHLSFDFTLETALAEHKKITFTLGKYVPSINKTYEPETFSITCDSPPHAATRVSAAMDGSERSVLGIVLPKGTSDDDLAQLRITWQEDGAASASSESYAIGSLPASGGSTVLASGGYDRFFQAGGSSVGKGCAYSVVVIDKAGQESKAASATSSPNHYPFSYDANGATSGTPPATVGYAAGSSIAVGGQGSLARSGYGFTGWDTLRTGGGTSYAPGSTYAPMPVGEVVLYAQWEEIEAPTGTISFSFVLGNAGLAFTPSDATFPRGSRIELSCSPSSPLPTGTIVWRWYLDGDLSWTGPSFIWQTDQYTDLGQHILSCVATCGGLSYSGSARLNIVQ